MADEGLIIYKCKYWSEYEPTVCEHWDTAGHSCTFESEDGTIPSAFPFCNYLGNYIHCDEYTVNDQEAVSMCILPDPSRHVCNRATGDKWVPLAAEGEALDYSAITMYNDGLCDENGTSVTCAGYNPAHMSFGILSPADEGDVEIDTFEDGKYSTIAEIGYRIPINFVIYNIMAALSKCYWWDGIISNFVINAETLEVELKGEWECTLPEASIYNEFSEEYGRPCNGCKGECPNYTGTAWEHCISDKLRSGDPVLAEHIHELRYYFRSYAWTIEKLQAYFYDSGYIYAWDGTLDEYGPTGNINIQLSALTKEIESYDISAVQTYMDSFDLFEVKTSKVIITEGTTLFGNTENFPTLIRDVAKISLPPIIMNKFDVDGQDNYFEVNKLLQYELLIFGKTFYSSQVYPVYGINISDAEIRSILPIEVIEFDSMLDIELDKGKEAYATFVGLLEQTLVALKGTGADKVFYNIAEEHSTFIFNGLMCVAEDSYTCTNLNTIMVVQETPDGIEYSKVDFKRIFVGGMLRQREFNISGYGKTQQPFDYTVDFNMNINNNGNIDFDFIPVSFGTLGAVASYMYNDYEMGNMTATNATTPATGSSRGYKLYKLSIANYLTTYAENIDALGEAESPEFMPVNSDGYILLNLNNIRINNVFGPWEVSEITLLYEDDQSCELEILYHGADGLIGPNQAILYPKDIHDFSVINKGTTMRIEDLCYYEKRSYDEEPTIEGGFDYELVGDEDGISYGKSKATVIGSGAGQCNEVATYSMTDCSFAMVPSVVINNSKNRPFSQYRTKPLGWVKQPLCPDVEIFYSWSAKTKAWINVPECHCTGGHDGHESIGTGGVGFSPPCGDHDIGSITHIGPMWWPYNNCDSYVTYDMLTNMTNGSFDVVGLFKGGKGEHGTHDMRMLGPNNNYASSGEGCNFLWPCTCAWKTSGQTKTGANVFRGWARYRGGSSSDLAEWILDGDDTPRFGNVNRCQVSSYRTIDSWQYEYSMDQGQNWTVSSKLMPAYPAFNDVDFTSDSEPMWNYGASSIGPNVVNPLGLFSATSLEGTSIGEEVDNENRFSFDEVFKCRTANKELLAYPVMYRTQIKDGKILRHYFEFKKYKDTDEFIQWAWREVWWPIERNYGNFVSKFTSIFLAAQADDYLRKGPFYKSESGPLTGLFSFLTIKYPDYAYNYKNKEFRKVVEEGEQIISFTAPEKDPSTGEYVGDFMLKLNDGPFRCFDITTGEWLGIDSECDEACDVEFYDEHIGEDVSINYTGVDEVTIWSYDITLFGSPSGLSEEEKTIVTYKQIDIGELEPAEVKVTERFYDPGLDVSLVIGSLTSESLPIELVSVFGEASGDLIDGEVVCGLVDTSTIVCDLDNQLRSIGKADFSFQFGRAVVGETLKYYHKPQITIYSSDDGETRGEMLYQSGDMELWEDDVKHELSDEGLYIDVEDDLVLENLNFNWTNTMDYLLLGKCWLIIDVRVLPTDVELSGFSDIAIKNYKSSMNLVCLADYLLYEDVIVNAEETVYTYERKYRVSHGACGDSSPWGDSEYTNALNVLTNDTSTMYQADTDDGIKFIDGSGGDNFTVTSKVRGRVLGKIYKNKTPIVGEPATLEKEQAKLYSSACNSLDDTCVFNPITTTDFDLLLERDLLTFSASDQLVLTNTLNIPVAAINSFGAMSGEGFGWRSHRYIKGDCSLLRMGPKDDVSFDYAYYCMDSNADNSYLITPNGSPLGTFLIGTATLLINRLLLKNLYVLYGTFSKYGSSTGEKIWADENTDMIYMPLRPMGLAEATTVNNSSGILGWTMDKLIWAQMDARQRIGFHV